MGRVGTVAAGGRSVVGIQARAIYTKDNIVEQFKSENEEKHLKYLYDNVYIYNDPRVSEEEKAKLMEID